MKNYVYNNLGEFPIHKLIQKLSLKDLLWDFDALGLYPCAISDPESIYAQIETGYAYTPDLNDKLVENFNNQTFTQGSAVLKLNYYNPKKLIVQHLPVKEKEKKIEISRMRNGYKFDTLTSVDIQEIDKIGGRVSQVYEGVF